MCEDGALNIDDVGMNINDDRSTYHKSIWPALGTAALPSEVSSFE